MTLKHWFKLSLLFWACIPIVTSAATPRPKLILVVVFDQFRADYLMRFESKFLPPHLPSGTEVGGFSWFMKTGAYFPYGEYEILQNMTGPGHATILTGSYPYQSGISLNYWFDPTTQKSVYCTEDPASPQIGGDSANPHNGTSPKLLHASTVGDELKNAGYNSKIVSVSIKDRAAILLGGHGADLALWYDPKARSWVSSKFYLPSGNLPAWVNSINEDFKKFEGKKVAWASTGPNSFTHDFEFGTRPWIATPGGSEMIATVATRAFDELKLGQGPDTDLLAVSFSSHDYAGHDFGPNSREIEEMTIAEDRILSKFLNHIGKKIPGGLSQVTLVLTGDHGVPPAAAWARAHKFDAGRIDEPAVAKAISDRLDIKFGKNTKSWVPFYGDLVFFLDEAEVASRGLDLAVVEAEAKSVAAKTDGVFQTFTRGEYIARKLPPGLFEKQIMKGYYLGRSGNIVLIPKPYYTNSSHDAVDHLTGYTFDRTVPIIFAGFGIKTGQYAKHAKVVDIAPTLTYIAGAVPPNMSEGQVLKEALKDLKK